MLAYVTFANGSAALASEQQLYYASLASQISNQVPETHGGEYKGCKSGLDDSCIDLADLDHSPMLTEIANNYFDSLTTEQQQQVKEDGQRSYDACQRENSDGNSGDASEAGDNGKDGEDGNDGEDRKGCKDGDDGDDGKNGKNGKDGKGKGNDHDGHHYHHHHW